MIEYNNIGIIRRIDTFWRFDTHFGGRGNAALKMACYQWRDEFLPEYCNMKDNKSYGQFSIEMRIQIV